MNQMKLAQQRAAERRRNFQVQVQAGRTAHGAVTQWTPEQIAALNAERGTQPKPVVFVPPKAAAPKPVRRVFVPPAKAPPKKYCGPKRGTTGTTIRERLCVAVGDGTLTTKQAYAALPDIGRDSVRAELKKLANRGDLVRVKPGVYRRVK